MAAVFLITGPKHCGKTTTANVLKEHVRCHTSDLDDSITERTGRTPRDLFTESPTLFRTREYEVLSSILREEEAGGERSPLILAAGGGLIDNTAACELIRQKPYITVIYLAVTVESSWWRIEHSARKDGALPAFLARTNDPRAAHAELHQRRAHEYAAFATLIIDAENKNAGAIADEIIAKTMLKSYRKPDVP